MQYISDRCIGLGCRDARSNRLITKSFVLNNTPFNTLLFDLDGTLSNPSEGIVLCLNYALSQLGYAEISEQRIHALIGPPLDQTFLCLIPDSTQSEINRLVSMYRERYAEVGYAENYLYPGVREVIEVLYDKGATMGLCTSKRQDFAEKILCHFGIRAYFDFVDGGDIGVSKSTQIKMLLDLGRINQNAVMIGDRAVDIQAAHANHIEAIGVSWGFACKGELQSVNADYYINDIHDLLQMPIDVNSSH